MVDLVQTAANVDRNGAGQETKKIAGETITAGSPCYINATDGKAYLAQADGTAAQAVVAGIALCGASPLQPVILESSGDIDLGATLTVGQVYVLSVNAGKIAPIADLIATNIVSILGVASAADKLKLRINNSGVIKA